jgi:hypothetical protein
MNKLLELLEDQTMLDFNALRQQRESEQAETPKKTYEDTPGLRAAYIHFRHALEWLERMPGTKLYKNRELAEQILRAVAAELETSCGCEKKLLEAYERQVWTGPPGAQHVPQSFAR